MSDEETEEFYKKRTFTNAVNDAVMERSIYDKPKKHIKQRNTAKQAHKSIQPELGLRQREVYLAIQMSKRPVNNAELATYLKLPINTIVPRTNELVKLNKVKKAFTAVYPTTNRRTIYWTVNENIS